MKTIVQRTATIARQDDGIIRFTFMKDVSIELEDAYEYVRIIRELCEGLPRKFLLDARDSYSHFSSEARKYMGTNREALEFRIADAIIINSLSLRIIANFYMKFDAKLHPVQIFNDEASAIKWLRGLTKKELHKS